MTRRGKFLTVMIATLVVGDIQIPYYMLNPDAVRSVYSDVPS